MAEAFAASGATVACLCSSDKVYAEQAVAVARAAEGRRGGPGPAGRTAWDTSGRVRAGRGGRVRLRRL
ncbi:methylmalonyl-CoA mutase small subunit (MCM-beta) [Streptomyces himastatinicus ATCC 53653]|uniref:Methylmalonyl-CoA mutase small subunit (MCM-beta) n=1 Tax=Streptomyces himastatinicus ATCC 53653 TaxID=457427 RepID=D9W9M3_9ACTN|nr:methylmalonyl-CoA mutase small subunit (MCM-beta) [Streptomyces himastatinicus ATCC 53653]